MTQKKMERVICGKRGSEGRSEGGRSLREKRGRREEQDLAERRWVRGGGLPRTGGQEWTASGKRKLFEMCKGKKKRNVQGVLFLITLS